MSREKNALRKHEVAPYEGEGTSPEEFLELAKWIEDIEDSSEDTVEDYSDYAGDGSLEQDVVNVREAYDFTGTYDPENEAQSFIAGLKRKRGTGRKIWHKITTADGKQEAVGLATVTNIIAGSGNAAEYETFSCTITYDEIPEETPVADSGNGGSEE